MGRRGPKPTPTATLKQRGSARAKTRKREPRLNPEIPEAPKWLDAKAKKYWVEICQDVAPMKVVALADAGALALLAESLWQYNEAKKLFKKHGIMTKTHLGNYIQNPAFGAMNKAWERVLKVYREFGMTPSSRTAVSGEKDKDQEKDQTKTLLRLG